MLENNIKKMGEYMKVGEKSELLKTWYNGLNSDEKTMLENMVNKRIMRNNIIKTVSKFDITEDKEGM